VVDAAPDELARFPLKLHPLHCVGLDRTVQSRGIAVLSADEYAAAAARTNAHIRFYKALTPQLHAVT
jgi:hypothetical protein